ncbi:MAG: hypothetical protein AAGH89_19080, partial [Verrucomicrobiota bacterium]
FLTGCVIVAGGFWVMHRVWLTQTNTPTEEQIAKARHILGIDPQLEIEPLGYDSWGGIGDWTHCLKFIAKTDDPATIFNQTLIDSRRFSTPYDDRAMDRCRAEWGKLPSHGLSGGSFRVKRDETPWRQDIWYRSRGEDTILVYTFSESG